MSGVAAILLNVVAGIGLGGVAAWLHHGADRHRFADWGRPGVNWIDGLNRWWCRRVHRLAPVAAPIPPTGPAIVVANHVSGLDPLLLVAASRRPLRFLIAREQYERFGLRWLFRAAGCIPVDRGTRPEQALRDALRALASGEVVALFPHGAIHLPDGPAPSLKRGALRLAALTGAPVVAARVAGVGAPGRVVSAVFVPGRAQLAFSLPFVVDAQVDETVIAVELQRFLIEER